MLLKAFVVRDSKGDYYSQPWFKNTHGEAEREFTKLARDPQTNINQFPEDYDLYHIGSYDPVKGIFLPLDTPQHLLKAAALRER